MEFTLVTVTVLALLMTAAMGVATWRIVREERRRADARVAALAARTAQADDPAPAHGAAAAGRAARADAAPITARASATHDAVRGRGAAQGHDAGHDARRHAPGPPRGFAGAGRGDAGHDAGRRRATAQGDAAAERGDAAAADGAAREHVTAGVTAATAGAARDGEAATTRLAEAPAVGGSLFAPPIESTPVVRTRLAAGAGAAALLLAVGAAVAALAGSGADEDAAPGVTGRPPLDLLALGHAADGPILVIQGSVQNPAGADTAAGVTVVATTFDETGALVASHRAPIARPALPPGAWSPFRIEAPADRVARYRISFLLDDAPVPHVDRRPAADPSAPADGAGPAGHPASGGGRPDPGPLSTRAARRGPHDPGPGSTRLDDPPTPRPLAAATAILPGGRAAEPLQDDPRC